jgi:peptidyl-prolyl cis-trans isomerase D
MLHLFRNKKEWLRWVLLFAIVAMGVTTVLLFVRTPSGLQGSMGQQEVAVVAGQKITAAEFRRYYQRLYDMYRQMYNLDKQSPELVKQFGIGQQALNQLIRQYAACYAAQQMGLSVPPGELISQISRLFQQNGAFVGAERYRQILSANSMTPTEFENSMRRDLLAQKLRDIMTDGVLVTPDEVRKNYAEANQEVKVRYVEFDPAQMKKEKVSEDTLKTYYDDHKEEFREPEERKFTLLNIPADPRKVEVTENQIQDELANIPSEQQVHARHILIRFGNDEAAARKKAEDILKQIKAGADFAEMARKYSDDTGTASKGGDLGFFGRGQMVPEFEQAAFSLKPGQVSGIVRSQFGFHIIQTIEFSGGSDAARRPAAEFNAKLKESLRQARELADKVDRELKSGASVEEVAKKYSLETVNTGFLDRTKGVPGLGLGGDFTNQVFSLAQGQISKPYESDRRFVIARVDEIKPSRLPDFAEVKTKVEEQYEQTMGQEMAQQKAKAFFDTLQKDRQESFESLAKTDGLSITTTGFFKKGATIDDNLKFSPEVQDQAASLDVGGVSTPIQVSNKYFVFQVAAKSPIDEKAFDSQKAQLTEQLTDQKRTQFFGAYVQNIVDTLRREQKIQINQDLFDRMTG